MNFTNFRIYFFLTPFNKKAVRFFTHRLTFYSCSVSCSDLGVNAILVTLESSILITLTPNVSLPILLIFADETLIIVPLLVITIISCSSDTNLRLASLPVLSLNIPALTEETRRGYVKQAKEYAEDCKIVLRNIRQDANNDIKKLELPEDDVKSGQEDVQDLICEYKILENIATKMYKMQKAGALQL